MDLTDLAINENSRSLVHDKGINPTYKLKSLTSWWDMCFNKRFYVLGMGFGALTIVYEGKKESYDQN